MNIELQDCIRIIADFPTIYQTENQTPFEIMKYSKYLDLFSLINIDNISNYLIQKPMLIESWINYSEDIRHDPAWAFWKNKNGTWEIAYCKDGEPIIQENYNDKFAACAKMIKMTFEEIRKNN